MNAGWFLFDDILIRIGINNENKFNQIQNLIFENPIWFRKFLFIVRVLKSWNDLNFRRLDFGFNLSLNKRDIPKFLKIFKIYSKQEYSGEFNENQFLIYPKDFKSTDFRFSLQKILDKDLEILFSKNNFDRIPDFEFMYNMQFPIKFTINNGLLDPNLTDKLKKNNIKFSIHQYQNKKKIISLTKPLDLPQTKIWLPKYVKSFDFVVYSKKKSFITSSEYKTEIEKLVEEILNLEKKTFELLENYNHEFVTKCIIHHSVFKNFATPYKIRPGFLNDFEKYLARFKSNLEFKDKLQNLIERENLFSLAILDVQQNDYIEDFENFNSLALYHFQFVEPHLQNDILLHYLMCDCYWNIKKLEKFEDFIRIKKLNSI